MALEVYGIPNCGTCKKAIAWLEAQKIAHTFINTRETPPSQEMVAAWVQKLGAKAMRNTSGQAYRALGSQKDDWNDEQWIKAFTEEPMLIKRPLFVKDGEAIAVGFRSPEKIPF